PTAGQHSIFRWRTGFHLDERPSFQAWQRQFAELVFHCFPQPIASIIGTVASTKKIESSADVGASLDGCTHGLRDFIKALLDSLLVLIVEVDVLAIRLERKSV